ncbi:MAG: Hsp20/alpha crystallin family protein [Flavisolibacter sp.]
MTLVRFNNQPGVKYFNNLMDDLLPSMPSLFREEFNGAGLKNGVPVNIRETESGYLLEVIAPGREKEDFRIDLVKNILTISSEKQAQPEKTEEKAVRTEFRFPSFKRSFTVEENIDAAAITAKYVNGVLSLNLPKKEEVKQTAKQITIA